MNRVLAQLASATIAIGAGIPEDIQWMPPGRHTITPFVDGEAKEMEIVVDAELGATVEDQFRRLKASATAGQADLPYLDFGHQDGAAAAHVDSLYWGGDDPKTGGIRAKVVWTKAGRDALEGRCFRRFSPSWFSDPKTGEFVGVGENLGGLVNRAAFRTIQPVVARRADQNTNASTMTEAEKLELKQLITAATEPLVSRLTALETKAASATQPAGQQTDARLGDIDTRLKQIEAATKQTTVAAAKAAVAVHARRGAIPPQDAETVAFWEAQYQADPAKTEAVMAKLPANPVLAGQYTTASAGAQTTAAAANTAEGFVAQVKAKCADGKINKADALQAVIATNPEGYKAWRDANGKPGI